MTDTQLTPLDRAITRRVRAAYDLEEANRMAVEYGGHQHRVRLNAAAQAYREARIDEIRARVLAGVTA